MFTKEEAKEIVRKIVERFEFHLDEYKKGIYNETQTRNDFINPFFEALGWDINNKQGLAESYREVIHEDKIKIGGHTKAPDYCFTIYGQRKFFLEAKKPSVSIKESIDPAYQLRRYGWSAKMPISIITDFEELSIYDCTIKPTLNDKASVARIKYLNCKEYVKEFDFLWDTFSKEMVLKGSFDKFVSSNKGKRGTSEVDKELLKLIEGWRSDLAKNIALRNNEIDIYNLNLAVQKIIDRIIFIRIAEDKGIEPYELLFSIAQNKDTSYKKYQQLDEIFTKSNKKYNAGLFQPEKWLSDLKIDDKVIVSIIKALYYPECPYEFSILPIEILGNIYEQFLGKTIQFRNVKDGHTVIIDEKPEVRKAGGVYYTPQYIVNYIVENTIGKRITDQSPVEISKIKICDPACGSGSFLVGAYQYLLNFHLNYYTNEKNLKSALKENKIYQVAEYNYKLTIEEKQRILINNIFGVDIDPQATQVTKLSLYLKLLENEGKEAEGVLFRHSDLKLLPTLENNIKCGNSLIGSDFYNDKDIMLFGNEEMRKINVFDWEKEFPEVFKEKQLVTYHITWETFNSRKTSKSNIASEINLNFDDRNKIAEFLDQKIEKEKYRVISLNVLNDHVHCVIIASEDEIEKIVGQLKGFSSFEFHRTSSNINHRVNPMVDSPQYSDGTVKKLWGKGFSHTYINSNEHLLNTINYIENNHLKHNIQGITYNIKNLTSYSDAYKPIKSGGFDVVIGNPPYVSSKELPEYAKEYMVKFYEVAKNQFDYYTIFISKGINILEQNGLFGYIIPDAIIDRSSATVLRKFILKRTGINVLFQLYNVFDHVSVGSCILILSNHKNQKNKIRYIKANDYYCYLNGKYKELVIEQNKYENTRNFAFYFFEETKFNLISKIFLNKIQLGSICFTGRGEELGKNNDFIIKQKETNSKEFIKGENIQRYNISFENLYINEKNIIKNNKLYSKKIVVRQVGKNINASFDEIGYITLQSIYSIVLNDNKFYMNFLLGIINSKLIDFIYQNLFKSKELFPRILLENIKELPIPNIDFSNLTEKAQHVRLVSLVDSMLETQKQYHAATTDADKKLFKQKIDILDHQIDSLVYQLYGLTEEEIRIVEGE